MKWFFALLTVVSLSLTAWCQGSPQSSKPTTPQKPKPSPFQDYAGKWTASFEGRPWLNLQLELSGDYLTGSLQHAQSFELNDNGELRSISDERSSGTVIAATINPDGVILTVKDPVSQETDRYMMRIVTKEKDNAELKMIAESMPPGMPKPRPWRVIKSDAAHTNNAATPH